MRISAQKKNQPRQGESLNLIRPTAAASAATHNTRVILHLQRTVGNQAIQRLLHANQENPGGNPEITASGFAHDFSRIPVYTKPPVQVQAKLMVNTPDDIYEQEATRLADQVMRMPEPQLQRACPYGRECPKCQAEHLGQVHPLLQTRRVQAHDPGKTAAPPIVHRVLHSSGQSLDSATRAFFEPRFGHDFSHVRIHTDAKAAESAAAVGARAYTVGRDIVFGAGLFSPNSRSGQELLAHELTHVAQQRAVPCPSPQTAHGPLIRHTLTAASLTRDKEKPTDAELCEAPFTVEEKIRCELIKKPPVTDQPATERWKQNLRDLFKSVSPASKAREVHERLTTKPNDAFTIY